MNTLKMKITGYDEESNSLLVAFASDDTAFQNPESYPSLAYQPLTMWPDVTDIDTLKKNIAVSGMWQVEQQAKKEAFIANPAKIAEYKALVGQEIEYNISDLIPPAPELEYYVFGEPI
jgi:hypothetical protein